MPMSKSPSFVRFVVHERHPDSGRRKGILQAMYDLLDSADLTPADRARLEECRVWFNPYLKVPERLSLSAKPNKKGQAIGWFKEGALEHIAQIRAMIMVLEAHGVAVEEIRTRRP